MAEACKGDRSKMKTPVRYIKSLLKNVCVDAPFRQISIWRGTEIQT